CLLIYNDKHWRNFFALIGQPELGQDPRFHTHGARAAHIDEVYAFVADVIRARPSQDWLRDLAQADIPASQLYTVDDLLGDEHLAATGFVQQQDHPTEGRLRTPAPLGRYQGTPTAIRRPAPTLGQHSREVLAEAGYDDAAIDALFSHRITQDGTH
ncbi:CoA transferase, partial [Achromobacter xylosoxidans]